MHGLRSGAGHAPLDSRGTQRKETKVGEPQIPSLNEEGLLMVSASEFQGASHAG